MSTMPRANVQSIVIVTRRRGSSLLYRLGGLLEPVPGTAGRSKVLTVSETAAADTDRQPHVTELVHYMSFGNPTGKTKACRPALVVEVLPNEELELTVFRTNGVLFERCRHEESRLGGTWHYHHDDAE